MYLKVDVPIAVVFYSDPKKAENKPVILKWDGREYRITKIGLHHTFREGRTLFHIFSVVSGETFFRLNFNTDTLSWRLEEVSDGLPN